MLIKYGVTVMKMMVSYEVVMIMILGDGDGDEDSVAW